MARPDFCRCNSHEAFRQCEVWVVKAKNEFGTNAMKNCNSKSSNQVNGVAKVLELFKYHYSDEGRSRK